jgi:hypothetical protein
VKRITAQSIVSHTPTDRPTQQLLRDMPLLSFALPPLLTAQTTHSNRFTPHSRAAWTETGQRLLLSSCLLSSSSCSPLHSLHPFSSLDSLPQPPAQQQQHGDCSAKPTRAGQATSLHTTTPPTPPTVPATSDGLAPNSDSDGDLVAAISSQPYATLRNGTQASNQMSCPFPSLLCLSPQRTAMTTLALALCAKITSRRRRAADLDHRPTNWKLSSQDRD